MGVQEATAVATALVAARRASTALDGFPGAIPADLDAAYVVQNIGIGLRQERVVGWKVGMVPPQWRERAGAERLVGPVVESLLWSAPRGRLRLPAIAGGTACVEAEIVLEVGRDVPAGARTWTADDAREVLGGVRLAVELAGSPVPDINGLGPMAVASDFGNNAGLVLGPRVTDDPATWLGLACRTWVDGELVGAATPGDVPGTPLEAFRFALQVCTARGHALRAGDVVATGAVTGVHDVRPGQSAELRYGDLFQVEIDVVEALSTALHPDEESWRR
ncbi:2-keto-4-pentenoate hydratase [Cellulomonas hominis]|nr:2-keto-4-pentenoate hydratase [Cellulomonas hominis]